MEAVFRPRTLVEIIEKIIENAVKDFSPDAKDNAIKLLIPGKGKYLEKNQAKLETE